MTSIPTAERIALFLDQAEVLRSSTAVSTIADTKLTMKGTSSGDLAVEVEAPGDEATITYFTRIREFDTKGKDIYVADLLPELERSASPRRLALVEFLRRAHRDLGREIYDRPHPIPGDTLLKARALSRSLSEQAELNLELPPGPNSVLAYRVRMEAGTIAFADTSRPLPRAFTELTVFTKDVSEDICGIRRR